MTDQERIDGLLRHINLVRENCGILAERLITKGEFELAKGLLKLSFMHDNSKFSGIEWQFLTDPSITNKSGLKYAIEHHQKTNPHHPEYWLSGVSEMPTIYRYEMIADVVARGAEMGTSARDYITTTMPKKYGYTKESDVDKYLLSILDMLCPKPFEILDDNKQETNQLYTSNSGTNSNTIS